jgi:hypothetical protein
MAYKGTAPTTPETNERLKEIRDILKTQRQYPKLAIIDAMDIMTTDYLYMLKTKIK